VRQDFSAGKTHEAVLSQGRHAAAVGNPGELDDALAREGRAQILDAMAAGDPGRANRC